MFERITQTFTAGDSEESDDGGKEVGSEYDEQSGQESKQEVTASEKAKSFLSGKRVLDEEEVETHLDEFRLTLLQNNVAMEVADEVISSVKKELIGEKERVGKSSSEKVRSALHSALTDVLSHGQSEEFIEEVAASSKPFVVLFTGVNGVGKTTSIAKLSKQLEEEGYSTVLANGDTYRAGAQEQIRTHADAIDKKLITHEQGGDPTAVLYDAVEYAEANNVDVVLGDTAGRLHTSDDLMTQLEKINRVVDPDKVVFVDEAVAGQDAINRAEQFDTAATIDAVLLTKADADENGGAILSLPYLLEKPIYYLGVGQQYTDLKRFTPEELATQLLTDED